MFRIFFFSFVVISFNVSAQSWNWAKNFGGSSYDSGLRQVVDANGNAFTFSTVYGSVNFGSGAIATHGSDDVLITKHNAAGTLIWYRLIGGTQQDGGGNLTLDSSGNIYVCGRFKGTMICGPDTLISSTDDIFVTKLNSAGQFVWARKAGSPSTSLVPEYASGITYSYADNSIVFTGSLQGTATFGPFTVSNSGSFLAKLDVNGNWMWVIPTSTISLSSGYAVTADATGNIYYTISDNAVYALRKYDASGNQLWSYPASSSSAGWKIALDQASGVLYVSGKYNGPIHFGPDTLPAPSYSSAAFLLKYDTSGTIIWARDFQSSGIYLDGLTLTPVGDIIVGGRFSNTLYVDTSYFFDPYLGGFEGFVAKLNPNGSQVWFKQVGTDLSDEVYGVGYWSGKVYVAGVSGGIPNGSFAPLTFGNYGNSDVFIAQFNDCTPPYTQVVPASTITICQGDSIHLQSTTTSSAYTYQWQDNGVPINGATGTSLNMVGQPAYSGGLAVQITANGCSYTSHYVAAFIYPRPVVNMTTTNYGANCNRDSVQLTASNLPLHHYQWYLNGNPLATDTLRNYMVHSSGDYYLVVTSPFNCSDTFFHNTFYIGQTPNLTAYGDTAICAGSAVNLFANGAASYSWSPASTLTNPTAASTTAVPTLTTTYTVTGTTANCSDTAQVTVIVFPYTPPTISYNGYLLSCNVSNVSYQWYCNATLVTGATSQVIAPTQNGAYIVVITDTNGCTYSSPAVQVVNSGLPFYDNSSMRLKVYPSPMEESSIIELPYMITDGTFELYNSNGKLIRSHMLDSANEIKLSRDGLPSGLYFIRIISTDEVFTGTIMMN